MSLVRDTSEPQWLVPCATCGHERRDHYDMFQRCEECSCRKFVGPVPALPANNMYGPYGYVGPYEAEDESCAI